MSWSFLIIHAISARINNRVDIRRIATVTVTIRTSGNVCSWTDKAFNCNVCCFQVSANIVFMFSMLWTIKFMLFFFAVLTTLFYVFLSIFIDDVYLHLALRFFMVYFCLLDVFLLCSVFFSYFFLFFFFSLFSFTAYPFSKSCALFARDFQQLFTILSSIH